MRGVRNYQIRKESFEDMREAGRYSRSLEITFRDKTGEHTHKIGPGYSDDIDVYREGSEIYILSRNHNLGYFGLEIFEGSEKVGDMFVESHQVKDILGRDDLAPFNAIKRMAEYIQ